jgi:ketosteroid isomerase-like protein
MKQYFMQRDFVTIILIDYNILLLPNANLLMQSNFFNDKSMKTIINCLMLASITLLLFACNQATNEVKDQSMQQVFLDTADSKKQIYSMLDSFNLAAARADFDTYFKYFADDATFIGTDATEYWNKERFMIWAKPYFDKKTTWNFKSMERHIYFTKNGDVAWFDELLSTQMKICRGSGVVVKQNNKWKVKQYVLSMTIPNSETQKVVEIKTAIEDSLINKLENK